MYILDAELKDQMKYEGVSPNVWILPGKMSIYMTMVPSAEVEFYRKGGAADNLEKGPDTFCPSVVAKCSRRVHSTLTLSVSP